MLSASSRCSGMRSSGNGRRCRRAHPRSPRAIRTYLICVALELVAIPLGALLFIQVLASAGGRAALGRDRRRAALPSVRQCLRHSAVRPARRGAVRARHPRRRASCCAGRPPTRRGPASRRAWSCSASRRPPRGYGIRRLQPAAGSARGRPSHGRKSHPAGGSDRRRPHPAASPRTTIPTPLPSPRPRRSSTSGSTAAPTRRRSPRRSSTRRRGHSWSATSTTSRS